MIWSTEKNMTGPACLSVLPVYQNIDGLSYWLSNQDS